MLRSGAARSPAQPPAIKYIHHQPLQASQIILSLPQAQQMPPHNRLHRLALTTPTAYLWALCPHLPAGCPPPQPWPDYSFCFGGFISGMPETSASHTQSRLEGLIRNANPKTPPSKALNLQRRGGAWTPALSANATGNPVDCALRSNTMRASRN